MENADPDRSSRRLASAAEQLHQNQELLRLCIESAPAGIAVFDREMHYLAASRRYLQDLSIPDQPLIGRSHYEVLPDIPDRWREILRRCLAGAHERCDADPFVRANGSVEWYRWEIRPWHDAAGELGGIVLFSENITQLMREQERQRLNDAELRRNAEIFAALTSSMDEFVLLVDENAEFVYANATARKFLAQGDGAGLKDWVDTYELYDGDGATPLPPWQWPMMRAIAGERVDSFELVCRRRGEQRRARLVVSARPLRDPAGASKGAILVFRDITRAKETERQLQHAQKMDAIGQLTGGIAHDFNNLLTVITGTIEILADGVADRADLASICAMIDEAAERGAHLTQHLLAFARRQPLQPRKTDVSGLVISTVKLLGLTLGEHIEIESMLRDDAWPALVDPSQLSTAILNLTLNARDAMPNGGKLMLETDNVVIDASAAGNQPGLSPDDYVVISVSDSGSGIPAAIRDRVFEPFFTTKGAGRGSGLGLSMVYGFVKQSNGHVEIDSEEGRGTTVKLYLPRCKSEERIATNGASAAGQGGTETILVVEDDAMVRHYVVAQLASLGYTTLSAATGDEALALVDQGAEFDLLFTDVIMPGMNGRELAEELARRRPGLRVLYTSGYTEDTIGRHGRLDPGLALLSKPYRKTDLAQKIREVLTAAPRAA